MSKYTNTIERNLHLARTLPFEKYPKSVLIEWLRGQLFDHSRTAFELEAIAWQQGSKRLAEESAALLERMNELRGKESPKARIEYLKAWDRWLKVDREQNRLWKRYEAATRAPEENQP